MNLHILPDSKFSQVFYQNIESIGLLDKNKFVVRSNAKKLRYLEADLPFAKAGSSSFGDLVGDTFQYDKVFIHNFSPVLYKWVATNSFRELNWMIWGADLYNLPFIQHEFLETKTKSISPKTFAGYAHWLYEMKIKFTALPFKKRAYSKISRVFTWMKTEYEFAKKNIPSLQASYAFFFYENQLPYEKLSVSPANNRNDGKIKALLVGNSGYAVNNHLDAIDAVKGLNEKIQLQIPVSYGDAPYISNLKKVCAQRAYTDIEFIDYYMTGEQYLGFLSKTDGLIMNTIRPQGYGNILMMMALRKPVFFNMKNLSIPDLLDIGITPLSMDNLGESINEKKLEREGAIIKSHFSHERLIKIYTATFH